MSAPGSAGYRDERPMSPSGAYLLQGSSPKVSQESTVSFNHQSYAPAVLIKRRTDSVKTLFRIESPAALA